MSFVVSFQGQFKPYSVSEATKARRVNEVLKSHEVFSLDNHPDSLQDVSEEQKQQARHRQKQSHAANTYIKNEKEAKRKVVPHHARDIMSRGIKFLSHDNHYDDAIELMEKHDIRHLPVLSEGKTLIGMVSRRDLIRIDGNPKITDIMAKEVISCFENATLQDISRIMLEQKISALPIINLDYKLIGIVTKSDILKFVSNIISVNGLY